jgi:hypothetical protein
MDFKTFAIASERRRRGPEEETLGPRAQVMRVAAPRRRSSAAEDVGEALGGEQPFRHLHQALRA